MAKQKGIKQLDSSRNGRVEGNSGPVPGNCPLRRIHKGMSGECHICGVSPLRVVTDSMPRQPLQ